MNPKPWWAKLGHWSLMLLATVYCLFPIYFMLVQSLKTPTEDVFGSPLIVRRPTRTLWKLWHATAGRALCTRSPAFMRSRRAISRPTERGRCNC